MSLTYKSTDGCAKGAIGLSKQVINLKQDAEKRRIQNDAVFQDWMEHKIATFIGECDEEDSITLTLPEVQGDATAQYDYPDYIHFLKGMEDEGEGSDDVFSVSGSSDDWFVKSVESEVQVSSVNHRTTTHFKVVVAKVITYQCTICEDYQVRSSMMTNGFDCYICEDCHAAFEMM